MPKLTPKLTVDILETEPLPIKDVVILKHLQQVFDEYHPSSVPLAAIELLITGDDEMRRLNREHRGIDKTTDVLSLPTAIDSKRGPVLPTTDKIPLHLGSVVISLPYVQQRSADLEITLEKELLCLAEHGLRHLLGHDHDDAGRWTNDAS